MIINCNYFTYDQEINITLFFELELNSTAITHKYNRCDKKYDDFKYDGYSNELFKFITFELQKIT